MGWGGWGWEQSGVGLGWYGGVGWGVGCLGRMEPWLCPDWATVWVTIGPQLGLNIGLESE